VPTVGSFTAPVNSDYELSEQALHLEIEWVFRYHFQGDWDIPISGYRASQINAEI